MSNIFPQGGGPRTDVPFGMPDFSQGDIDPNLLRRAMDLQEFGGDNSVSRQSPGRLPAIAKRNVGNQQGGLDTDELGHPLNVVYKAPISDQYATRILMGPDIREQQLAQKTAQAQQGFDIKR